jgi:transposase
VTLPADDPLPEDVETLKAMLLAERSARRTAEAQAHERALQIEKLRHTIAKLRHARFGQSAERRALLDQLELQLFELEEDEAQAETAAQPQTTPCSLLSVASRGAGRCPSTCHANGWSTRYRRPARAAAVACASWART